MRNASHTYAPIFGRPPGGESLADVVKRGYLFLGLLFRERGGQRVLVVTHGGTLWMFRMVLERWTGEEAEGRFRMVTTSTILRLDGSSSAI